MIPILYASDETAFVSNGLGRLSDCISCKVNEGINDVYECDFEYPITGVHYEEIIPSRIIGVTHDETGDIQPFDIVGYSRPVNGVVTFHAVHLSYRLSGFTVWGKDVYNSETALDKLNAVSGIPFNFSADFIKEQTWFPCFDGIPRTVRQMMGGVEGSILDVCHGEWEFDKWNVTLHRNRGVVRDFSIRYGVNMSDYQEEADYSGIYTSVIPFWTDGNGTVVRGSRYDADLPSYNGRRSVVPLDLSDAFENKPTNSQLLGLAMSMMSGGETAVPNQTITANFVRLEDSPEYAQLADLLSCNLGDTIGIIFPAYGMQGRMKIVRTLWDVLADRYEEMELGTLQTSFAEALGVNQPSTEKPITDLTMFGDLNVGGTITTGGHSSQIGDIRVRGMESDTVVHTATGTALCALTLPAGTWSIVGFVRFPANNNGVRRANIVTTRAANDIFVQNQPTQGGVTQFQVCNVVTITSETTYYLNVYHTAGVDLTLPAGTTEGYINGIRAVRIA